MNKKPRLHFIDALRAFAILMMLQGHFVDTFLSFESRDTSSMVYNIWLYCRGFTAPVFFTVTGFVFTYLLLRHPIQGKKNPRLRKGFFRGLELLVWGYALRLNIWGLFLGQIYPNFYITDVLHIIGVSLIVLVSLYWLGAGIPKALLGAILVSLTFVIFLSEPFYRTIEFTSLPTMIGSYLTQVNGGVFYIFPWLGYVTIGSFLALLMNHSTKSSFPKWSFWLSFSGVALICLSSTFIDLFLSNFPDLVHPMILKNPYLFHRLGDTFLLFALFMLLENRFREGYFLEIGQRTLSVYIIHYILLYGGLLGYGLKRIIDPNGLSGWTSALGAISFMAIVVLLVLGYYHSDKIQQFQTNLKQGKIKKS